MIDFEFYNPCRLVFGKDRESELPALISQSGGKKILVHFGGGSVVKNGILEKVLKALDNGGIEYVCLSGVKPNPRLELCLEGIRLVKEHELDFVLAIGGGSVIDSSKCIAAGSKNDDIWSYYMDNSKEINGAIPIGVVLTMPAAGSESSNSTVITNEETQNKRYIGSDCLTPKFALLNPEYNYSMPANQIANGVSDIFAHLMERYFTPELNVDFTDRLIEAAMTSLLINAPLALKNPTDYNIRAEILVAGTLAHNGMLDVGRLTDWASHDIEHELSGIYDIPHGAGLSIIFPAWLRFQSNHNKTKLLQFANRVMNVNEDSDENTITAAIEKLEDFYKSLGLPIRLKEVGIGEDKFKEMALKAVFNRGTIGNYKKLDSNDIFEILMLAR